MKKFGKKLKNGINYNESNNSTHWMNNNLRSTGNLITIYK